MLDDFFLRAMIAGLGVAVAAGPLGCFIVWRRMAYFSDSLAHSSLLGIALGFLLGINLTFGIIAACLVLAVVLAGLQAQKQIATDTLLGILTHAALSIGLVVLSLMEGLRVDLIGYLFGDILAVTRADIYWVLGGGIIVIAALAFLWRPLLASTVQEDLARAEGVPTATVRLIYMLLIAMVIAISMKIIGVLLVTSLLIIPAASARRFSKTPEQMAVVAAGIGALSVIGGLFGSLRWDTPSGPSIVVTATLLFAVSFGSGMATARGRI